MSEKSPPPSLWSKELAPLRYFAPGIFIGQNESEERVCAFALALALYANDAKVLLGLGIAMIQSAPKFLRVTEELGEYVAQNNYLHRLIYSHLHELHFLFMSHYNEVSTKPLFVRTLSKMSMGSRKSWDELVRMSLDKNDAMKVWLKNVRDGLGFHYVRHKDLMEGYRAWMAELKPGGKFDYQEGAYISPGLSVKETRYYFADGAIDLWMGKEIKTFPNPTPSLEALMERNVIAISGFINGFLKARGAILKQSKYPELKILPPS